MSIEEILISILIERNYKISTAESCTAGLLAAKLVNVPNVSKVFDCGFITYSNESKIHYLNVQQEAINEFGVVSEQVAIQMAQGAAKNANANIGVGITGIAGPGGKTKNKPIGMVCFGITIEGKNYTYTNYFKEKTRNNIRNASINYIIMKIIELLNG